MRLAAASAGAETAVGLMASDPSPGALAMRLLRRTTKPGRSAGPRRRTEARTAPPSAVTSWLRQGLSGGICPLCRVAHKADREYIWQFYDERSNDGAVID